MSTKQAATDIRNAMRDLNAGRITADECRAVFACVRDAVGEDTYQEARWIAVCNDQ